MSYKIKVVDALVIIKDGYVVGSLAAEYDFSEIPVELHTYAFTMIRRTQRLILCHDVTTEEVERMSNRPWWKFW